MGFWSKVTDGLGLALTGLQGQRWVPLPFTFYFLCIFQSIFVVTVTTSTSNAYTPNELKQCSRFVIFCTIWIYFICLSRSMSLMVTGLFKFFPIKSAELHYSFHSQQPSQQIMFCVSTPGCRTGESTQWGKASMAAWWPWCTGKNCSQ